MQSSGTPSSECREEVGPSVMGRTMHTVLEGPANALDLCKDCTKVVVAGRSVFKIYSIEEEEFVERDNLRVGKNINLALCGY